MDLFERAGEGYLSRKVMGLPQQLENLAVKQFKDPQRKDAGPARSKPPPQVHAAQKPAPQSPNALVTLRDAEKDEEIARLRKQLAATRLERNDARYVPHSSYSSRRSSPDTPLSPLQNEYHHSSRPKREIGRDEGGRLMNFEKPRHSPAMQNPRHEPQPPILDLSRRRSVAGPASSVASSDYTPSNYPQGARVVPLYAAARSHYQSNYDSGSSHHSSLPRHYDDHAHGSRSEHASRHRPHRRSESVQVGESWAHPSVRSRDVQYGWEPQEPRSRRRSQHGWDAESLASGSTSRDDVRSHHSHHHDHGHGHSREREIREQKIITRSPLALPDAPPPPASVRRGPGSVKAASIKAPSAKAPSVKALSVRGGSIKAPSVYGDDLEDAYNLIEIEGGPQDAWDGPRSFVDAEGYDVIEVVEDGAKRRRKVRRRSVR